MMGGFIFNSSSLFVCGKAPAGPFKDLEESSESDTFECRRDTFKRRRPLDSDGHSIKAKMSDHSMGTLVVNWESPQFLSEFGIMAL